MNKLTTPLSEEKIRSLNVGDFVEISGELTTARDIAHAYLTEKKRELPFSLDGSIIYHVGPIVKKEDEWKIISAGPTTSIREEMYESEVIKNYGVRAVIGKGGMGKKTLNALKEFGAVYLSAVGGTASVLADYITEVIEVHKLEEFGIPEAMWRLKVEDFPAIVTMDSKGKSLHDKIELYSFNKLKNLL